MIRKTITIDEAEIAVLIVEGMYGIKRPHGVSAVECLQQMDAKLLLSARNAAVKVSDYVTQQILEMRTAQ